MNQTNKMNNSIPAGLDIYLNFPGCCQEAFAFYEKHFGGRITAMAFHEAPPAHFPEEWVRPVLHATIEIAGMVLRGADIPDALPVRSAYLTLRCRTAAQAEHFYGLLSQGEHASIFIKMTSTFFANRFAMLRDPFGVSWMLLHEH